MVIEKDTILYFSGTGNSLQVAKDISAKIGGVQLCKLASLTDENKVKVKSKILGIVFPVYYARLPLVVESVLNKLEIDKDTYVFAIATFAGSPAEVLNKLSNTLQSNGKTLNSGFLIRMPGNNIYYFGAMSLKRQNKDFKREKDKVKEISYIIKLRKNCKYELSKLLIDIPIDRIFIKSTNKIMENFHIRDKKFWVNENCNGCGVCKSICPVNNIEIVENKPKWKHNCEQCTSCIQYCPNEAIQWGIRTVKRKRYKNPNVNINELMVR